MDGSQSIDGSGQRMCLLTHVEISISCWPAHLCRIVVGVERGEY